MCIHRGRVFQSHIPQFGEEYNLLILVILNYTLHFSFGRRFSCWGEENRTRTVIGCTQNKILNKRGIVEIHHIVFEMTQIIICSHFWGIVYILNKDNTICISIGQTTPNRSGIRIVRVELISLHRQLLPR